MYLLDYPDRADEKEGHHTADEPRHVRLFPFFIAGDGEHHADKHHDDADVVHPRQVLAARRAVKGGKHHRARDEDYRIRHRSHSVSLHVEHRADDRDESEHGSEQYGVKRRQSAELSADEHQNCEHGDGDGAGQSVEHVQVALIQYVFFHADLARDVICKRRCKRDDQKQIIHSVSSLFCR